MAFIDDYAPAGGTVTLTNGLAAFSTSGAALQAAGVAAGDDIRIKGWVATIATIADNNSGTLSEVWQQPTQTAQPLRIRYAPDQSRVQASVVALLERLSNGNIDKLAGLDLSASDKLVFNDVAGSLSLAPLTAFARTLLDDADAMSVLSTLGATAVGKALLAAADATAAQTTIGATAVGKALLAAADAGTALSTLGVSAFVKTLLDDADAATVYATLGEVPALQLPDRLKELAVSQSDLNAITKSGFYFFTAGTSLNGPPVSGMHFYVLHIALSSSSNAHMQFAIATSGRNRVFMRKTWFAGGVWEGWEETYTSGRDAANTGYARLTNGVIMQWGRLQTTAGSTTPVTFPIAFPTAGRMVQATGYGVLGTVLGSAPTQTGFTVAVYNTSSVAITGNVMWLAVGD